MSSMKTQLYRSADHRVLKVDLEINYASTYDVCVISFKCKDETIDIISTSAGKVNLKEKNIEVVEENKLQIYLEYCTLYHELECLIGYYDNKVLQYYENLSNVFDSRKPIEANVASIMTIPTVLGSFSEKLSDFKTKLKSKISSWRVEVSCPDDILLIFHSSSEIPATMSFGEVSEEVLASDYLFTIDPTVSILNLPKDIVKKQYPKYLANCQLGVFEIVRPDFMPGDYCRYKTLISNSLGLSDFAG